MKFALLAATLALTALPAVAWAADDLKPYPASSKGQVQHVIRLSALPDEEAAKVEIIVGKTMEIDCNHHFFGGELKKLTAKGWGYDYFVLDSLGDGASTLMGCPEGSERTEFVRSSGETFIRYNSKLPVVVYTPEDVEVRYRVWQAGDVEEASSE